MGLVLPSILSLFFRRVSLLFSARFGRPCFPSSHFSNLSTTRPIPSEHIVRETWISKLGNKLSPVASFLKNLKLTPAPPPPLPLTASRPSPPHYVSDTPAGSNCSRPQNSQRNREEKEAERRRTKDVRKTAHATDKCKRS